MLSEKEIEAYTKALIGARKLRDAVAMSSRVESQSTRSERIFELTRAEEKLALEGDHVRRVMAKESREEERKQ